MNAKAVVVLDEFQDIVDLNRFKGFGNGKILGFLQGIISGQKNVWYLFTGSAVRIMIDILEGGRAPFYGRVIRFNVTPFNRDDTAALVYKCTDKPVTDEALNLIYALSNGHPFYTRVIISAAEKISDNDVIVTRHDIEEAFITELFGGTLDSHCKYLFESSLVLALLNDLPDHFQQPLNIDRFLNDGINTALSDLLFLTRLPSPAGKHYERHLRDSLFFAEILDRLSNLPSIHAGHTKITDHHVHWILFEKLYPFLP